jgi:hypothetical protein
MKYAIFLFISAGLLFAACKKKSNGVGCYVCTYTTKVHSNIPVYDTPRAVISTGTTCNMNDGEIAFYVKTHSVTDTNSISITGDTIRSTSVAVTCIPQ